MRMTKTVLWRMKFGNSVLWREKSTKTADVRFEIWTPTLGRREQNDDKKAEDTK